MGHHSQLFIFVCDFISSSHAVQIFSHCRRFWLRDGVCGMLLERVDIVLLITGRWYSVAIFKRCLVAIHFTLRSSVWVQSTNNCCGTRPVGMNGDYKDNLKASAEQNEACLQIYSHLVIPFSSPNKQFVLVCSDWNCFSQALHLGVVTTILSKYGLLILKKQHKIKALLTFPYRMPWHKGIVAQLDLGHSYTAANTTF